MLSKASANHHEHYKVERLRRMHNAAMSVCLNINQPVAVGGAIGLLCIQTAQLSIR